MKFCFTTICHNSKTYLAQTPDTNTAASAIKCLLTQIYIGWSLVCWNLTPFHIHTQATPETARGYNTSVVITTLLAWHRGVHSCNNNGVTSYKDYTHPPKIYISSASTNNFLSDEVDKINMATCCRVMQNTDCVWHISKTIWNSFEHKQSITPHQLCPYTKKVSKLQDTHFSGSWLPRETRAHKSHDTLAQYKVVRVYNRLFCMPQNDPLGVWQITYITGSHSYGIPYRQYSMIWHICSIYSSQFNLFNH